MNNHAEGCLCTSCTTERELDRGGRYDQHIETFLHHIRDLRDLRQVKSSNANTALFLKEFLRPALDRNERS